MLIFAAPPHPKWDNLWDFLFSLLLIVMLESFIASYVDSSIFNPALKDEERQGSKGQGYSLLVPLSPVCPLACVWEREAGSKHPISSD